MADVGWINVLRLGRLGMSGEILTEETLKKLTGNFSGTVPVHAEPELVGGRGDTKVVIGHVVALRYQDGALQAKVRLRPLAAADVGEGTA